LGVVGGGRVADDLGGAGRVVYRVGPGGAWLGLASDGQHRLIARHSAFLRDRR